MASKWAWHASATTADACSPFARVAITLARDEVFLMNWDKPASLRHSAVSFDDDVLNDVAGLLMREVGRRLHGRRG